MTSQLLQTNSIHNKLRNIVDFFLETGNFEDLLEFEKKSIKLYVGKYDLEMYEKHKPIVISIYQKRDGGEIKIDIFDPGTENEWEHISLSSGGRDPHIKQILFDLPSKKAREMCTDLMIKKFIPKKLYDFLDNLNIDIIKTQLV